MRNRASCVKVKLPHKTFRKETIFLMSKSITQDMAYRQSLMKYAEKYGVSRASRKYNKSRSYIYFWKQRWDGSVASLACQSRRPHSHPNQHTEIGRASCRERVEISVVAVSLKKKKKKKEK